VKRNARRKRDGLVLVPDQSWQDLEELARRHDDLPVDRSHRARREPCPLKLVGLALPEADREGTKRLRHHRRHERGEPARVDAARQEQSERNVAQRWLRTASSAGPHVPCFLLEIRRASSSVTGGASTAAVDPFAERPRERLTGRSFRIPRKGLLARDEAVRENSRSPC
jgi:hypothetical protein